MKKTVEKKITFIYIFSRMLVAGVLSMRNYGASDEQIVSYMERNIKQLVKQQIPLVKKEMGGKLKMKDVFFILLQKMKEETLKMKQSKGFTQEEIDRDPDLRDKLYFGCLGGG